MRLLHLEDISVLLPGKALFESVTWSVFRGERYALVGVNGAGKTTLLRLMTGETEPSSGYIRRFRDLTVGYLPQEGITHARRTLFREAWSGLPDLPALQRDLERLRLELQSAPDDADVLEELGILQHRWEDLEGYRAESRVAAVLTGLGFSRSDFERPVEEFSGGWQMRIALAKLLLFDPDLLLLDEPTNHLDVPALLWLEEFLQGFRGAMVTVSHDRKFLDRTVSRVAELHAGKLTLYEGNYTAYETERENRREQQLAESRRAAETRKHTEEFIERFRFKASKARQVQSRIKQLQRQDAVSPVSVPQSKNKQVHFRFPSSPPSGRTVLELRGVRKSYGSFEVLREVDVVIKRGEKVALIGINGAGKSTLCRLIVGTDIPTAGEVRRGHNVTVDFFAQDHDFVSRADTTVLGFLEAEAGGASQAMLRNLLGAFLFSGDDVNKPVKVLSGGERSRLALARLLLRPSNFLILDEPTNHLDISSQEVLSAALRDYDGTLLVVSHDRYFLDGLVDRILELEHGVLRDFPGNLTEYLARKQEQVASDRGTAPPEKVPVGISFESGFKSREQKRLEAEVRNRVSAQMNAARKQVAELQSRIDSAERRQRELEVLLASEELYRDAEQCRTLLAEYQHLRSHIPELIAAWEAAELDLSNLEKLRKDQMESIRDQET